MEKIPATIVTGFLGAGKTTLIRHLLQHANGRRIALIINEFGDVGVDGEILKGCGDEACHEDDIVELSNGCICCTVADDFIPTMTRLIEREETPDHIVIETSGLALPQPLVKAFGWPDIRARVTVDGVVTVIDTPALAEGRFAHDEAAVAAQRAADPGLDHDSPLEELFEDQLHCADLILLNKTDLVGEDEVERLVDGLNGDIRPGTHVVKTRNGIIDPAVLLGLGAAAEDDTETRKSHHELEGAEEHDHDDFETFAVHLGEEPSREALLQRIERVIREHDVLRLKGFAALAGQPARLLVQAVGPRLNAWFDRPWRADEARHTGLVVIGMKGLDRPAIEAALRG